MNPHRYRSQVHWRAFMLNTNPEAIDVLREHPDRIIWCHLCENPSPAAVQFIEENLKQASWINLSGNPGAIDLLHRNQDRIFWPTFSRNPAIFTDDDALERTRQKTETIKQELMAATWHPKRMREWCLEHDEDDEFRTPSKKPCTH
jgi:hypothetical protein